MENNIIVHENYAVHFKMSDGWINFTAYFIIKGSIGQVETFWYTDKDDEQKTLKDFDENKAFHKLKGSYVWRGVWEGRLYFTDEEYWSEDLKELSDLFSDTIEPFCKEKITEYNDKK
ncbi:hypothetical protein Phi13:2_gp040 [Cellulophaga phage phi13:2]|uniref:Uncharacterized protein n=1 Tax=Cellulophaga phage phi13:2 TaxID=1328030 RepID=S0A4E8_9CAUD|nr:hypothetical protein Phi13:2_gp040 [Cellulophaga phage phi13:2]AGO49650.1 hypothetical protein Phi13:2_gp040 [Cellulophaga phage phi13:2]